jgi:hypothetical protein
LAKSDRSPAVPNGVVPAVPYAREAPCLAATAQSISMRFAERAERLCELLSRARSLYAPAIAALFLAVPANRRILRLADRHRPAADGLIAIVRRQLARSDVASGCGGVIG